MEHEGPPDAPWEISYEFMIDDVPFRWTLASRQAAGPLIRPVQAAGTPSGGGGSYERIWTALFGPDGDSLDDRGPLPPFSFRKLCRQVDAPVEAPHVQRPGASFRPELLPHQRFAELAGVPAWTVTSNRTYNLVTSGHPHGKQPGQGGGRCSRRRRLWTASAKPPHGWEPESTPGRFDRSCSPRSAPRSPRAGPVTQPGSYFRVPMTAASQLATRPLTLG